MTHVRAFGRLLEDLARVGEPLLSLLPAVRRLLRSEALACSSSPSNASYDVRGQHKGEALGWLPLCGLVLVMGGVFFVGEKAAYAQFSQFRNDGLPKIVQPDTPPTPGAPNANAPASGAQPSASPSGAPSVAGDSPTATQEDPFAALLPNLSGEQVELLGGVASPEPESRRIFPNSALPLEERLLLGKEQEQKDSLRRLQTSISRVLEIGVDYDENPSQLSDPVELGFNNTSEVLAYLRFVAFSMEHPSARDAVLNGLVKAYLALDRPDLAQRELGFQEAILWRVQSYNDVAQYYINKSDTPKAIEALEAVSSVLRGYREDQIRLRLAGNEGAQSYVDLDDVVATSVTLMGYVGRIFQAIALAENIGNLYKRNTTILKMVEEIAFNASAFRVLVPRSIALLVLENELKRLKNPSHPLHVSLKTYERIANLAESLENRELAFSVLVFLRDELIPSLPIADRAALYGDLIPSFVRMGEYDDAMVSIRSIESEYGLARALVLMGIAVGQYGEIEEALPLFLYALDITESINNTAERDSLYRDIAYAQSSIGRFRDAFNTSNRVENIDIRYESYKDLAQSLINFKQLEAAANLVDTRLPLMRQRAPLLAGIAEQDALAGSMDRFRVDIQRAYTSQGAPFNRGITVETFQPVIDVQFRYGSPEDDELVFNSIRDLILTIDQPFLQTGVILEIADAQAKRGSYSEARASLNTALQIVVGEGYQGGNDFSESILRIMDIQILLQDLLASFDSVALLTDLPKRDDFQAENVTLQNLNANGEGSESADSDDAMGQLLYDGLQKVASAAARRGEMELAIRAAKNVDIEAIRARVYARVAQDVAEYILQVGASVAAEVPSTSPANQANQANQEGVAPSATPALPNVVPLTTSATPQVTTPQGT